MIVQTLNFKQRLGLSGTISFVLLQVQCPYIVLIFMIFLNMFLNIAHSVVRLYPLPKMEIIISDFV